ncbi:MAG TPA: hypothetical protein VLH56_19000 [Dissulfurispiraceae bacterium]|nr:hypothetical protein [Dissulfurispiraceae bacterium]
MFDVDAFTNTVYDQATSTSMINVPEGVYNASIQKFTPREIQTRTGDKAVVMDLYWDVDDPAGAVKAATGRDKNQVRQSLFLDVLPNGSLDMSEGRNTQLGRLREALGQNQAGLPWGFQRLLGVPAVILVTHKMDGDKIYANVTKVGKLGENLS